MVDLFKDTTTLKVDQDGVECKVSAKAETEVTISVHARNSAGEVALCHALHALLHLATERSWDFETALAFARRFHDEEETAINQWEEWAAGNEQVS
jgi:hypothetical protein